jgi:hypothetical protein
MMNQQTGELTLHTLSVTLGPAFKREDLFALPIMPRSLVDNEPYHSYVLGRYEIAGPTFSVALSFYAQKLEAIGLTDMAAEFGTSWADWSEEKEQKRKQAHDRWLIQQIGCRGRLYDWGEVRSYFDARSGGSSIVLRYSWEGRPWSGQRRD